MKKVYKISFQPTHGRFQFYARFDKFLSVGFQNETVSIWYISDEEADEKLKEVFIAETGKQLPDNIHTNYYYLGTAQYRNEYVCHVFEKL